MIRGAGRRLLADALAGRRRTLLSAAAWSAVEGVPTLLSGLLIARAVQDGIDAGLPILAVEIGRTRDLTYPVDFVEQNFPYLRAIR